MLALISLSEAMLLTYLGYKVGAAIIISILIQMARNCFIEENSIDGVFLPELFVYLITSLLCTGKHLAANTLVPFYIRAGDDGSICINGM